MRILYVDESGDTSPLKAEDTKSQPVLVVLGLDLPVSELEAMTRKWVALKRRFFPGLCPSGAKPWDWQTVEIKGADLRKAMRSQSRRERRATIGFVDRALDLLDQHNARFAARVWVKGPGLPFDGRAIYTTSVQWLCERFQEHLAAHDTRGLVIADHRNPAPNINVAHSIFTQKVRALGDAYPNIIEVPVFGHSDNHCGLQLADVLASTLLAPICGHVLLLNHLRSDHVRVEVAPVAVRYLPRIQRLLMPMPSVVGPSRAVVVHNAVSMRGHAYLWSFPSLPGVPVIRPAPDMPSP